MQENLQLIPINKKRNIIFFIMLLLILVSCPLLNSGILSSSAVYTNHDLGFHLSRIDGIFNELKNGVFPVRMQMSWEEGYGYPVSIYYSDLFLYIPVILKLIGLGTVSAYKIYVLFIHAGTILISYYCFKKIFSSPVISLIATFAYVASPYRLVNIYVRAAVGEYTAMMFFPLIALSIYNIYKANNINFNSIIYNSILLSLGMSGVILSHILSTELIVIFLVIFCLLNIKKTFTKQVIITYFLAVVETILITAWFTIPFLDYYFNVDVKINHIADIIFYDDNTISLNSIFSFFSRSAGSSDITSQMLLTPGLVLTVTLIFSILLCINKKSTREIKIITIMSIVATLLALNLSWRILNKISLLGFLSNIQFTFRFLSILSVLLSLLLGFCIEHLITIQKIKINSVFYILTLTILICTSFFLSSYKDSCNIMIHQQDYSPNYDVIHGEYLLVDSKTSESTCTADNVVISEEKYENSIYIIKCETKSEAGTVSFPVFNYKGYVLTDNNGNEYAIESDENKCVKVTVPANFNGELILRFQSPWYWRTVEIISLISIVLILGYFTKSLCKKENHA